MSGGQQGAEELCSDRFTQELEFMVIPGHPPLPLPLFQVHCLSFPSAVSKCSNP